MIKSTTNVALPAFSILFLVPIILFICIYFAFGIALSLWDPIQCIPEIIIDIVISNGFLTGTNINEGPYTVHFILGIMNLFAGNHFTINLIDACLDTIIISSKRNIIQVEFIFDRF